MAKKQDGYLSAKESRRISKENRRITDQYEKRRKRRNVPESEYTTQMKDPANAVEFDNLHTYFFTDTGVVKSVDGVSFEVPIGKTVGVVGDVELYPGDPLHLLQQGVVHVVPVLAVFLQEGPELLLFLHRQAGDAVGDEFGAEAIQLLCLGIQNDFQPHAVHGCFLLWSL